MSADQRDNAARVDQLLTQAALKLTTEDRERLIRVYPVIQGLLPQLRLTEARYAEPALIYPAEVRPEPSRPAAPPPGVRSQTP